MDVVVTLRGRRALALRAELADAAGVFLSDLDIASPPVFQIAFDSGPGEVPVDVTEDALPVGQSSGGNMFFFDVEKWRYIFGTGDFDAPGTCTITMVSGDASECVIDSCVATFVVE